MKIRRFAVIILLFATSCKPYFFADTFSFGQSRHLRRAEEYLRQEEYDKAIEKYKDHIEYRLEMDDRPDWENPYFYYLLIGDIELRRDKLKEALTSYNYAEEKGVEKNLVSDRYRYVASYYEKKGNLKAAIVILKTYRDRDPLLFDSMLDRLAKELTDQEDHK